MTDLLDPIIDALVAYWSSPITLTIVAVCAASMGTLLYVFLANARNAKLRVSLLTGFYVLTIFFWAFVAASLFLCVMKSDMVAYETSGIRMAAAGAVLVALAAASLLSYLVWRFAARWAIRKFNRMDLPPEYRWVQDYVDLLAEFESTKRVPVRVVDQDAPLAMAVAGKQASILVSRGLLGLLDREEIEASVAHELMHLKHHDAEFKVFSIVFSRILFFDPFSKFFDPAVHREREYLADEASGRSTGKPAALASALLKIADRGVPPKSTWGLSIYGRSRGIFSRYPPLKERVQRLLLLSDLLGTRDGAQANR
ncbi:MAG TPA: M48 family metalloprotease [Thermoplasmata archaeon]|nr:M48 family metalloprotease [Thermoplasmata archaeon]